LAANDGYGFWLAPYAQESYLRPSCDPGEDIPFLNLGVGILPDADTAAKSCMPTVARGTRGASKLDTEAVHRTFNGRSAEVLRHLPDVAPDAPQAWRKLEKRVPATHVSGPRPSACPSRARPAIGSTPTRRWRSTTGASASAT